MVTWTNDATPKPMGAAIASLNRCNSPVAMQNAALGPGLRPSANHSPANVTSRARSMTRKLGNDVSVHAETSDGYGVPMPSRLAKIGAILADETRAQILTALMDGRGRTGGELARFAGVAPSTGSEHLSKLLDAGLVAVEAQGRHRYFRIANDDVAAMLESLGASAPVDAFRSRAPAALTYARSCYDHLAGELAVLIYDQLVTDGHLDRVDGHLRMNESGAVLLTGLGIDTTILRSSSRPLVRSCLDWTQRRHHLAGATGAALLDVFLERRWVTRGTQPRSIRLTSRGRTALKEHLGLGLLDRAVASSTVPDRPVLAP